MRKTSDMWKNGLWGSGLFMFVKKHVIVKYPVYVETSFTTG